VKITIRIATVDGEWSLQRPLPQTCSPANVLQALVDALDESAVPTTPPRLMVEFIPPRPSPSEHSPVYNSLFIECVKAVRTVGGLSLKEAKELCDDVRDNRTHTRSSRFGACRRPKRFVF